MRYRTRYRLRVNRRPRMFGGCAVWLLVVAFFLGFAAFRSGESLLLPLLFVVLAFIVLISSFFKFSPNRIYGGFIGFIWFMGLALCFTIGFWPWILIPVVLTALLGVLWRPLVAGLLGVGLFALLNRNQNAQTMYTSPIQPYQPPVQPYVPPQQPQQTSYYQPYGGGYQPTPEQTSYPQEDAHSQQYPSPHQYDQPQSHYPQQELPPQ